MPLAAVLRRHVDQAQPAVLGAGHHHGVGLTIERIGLRFARQLEQRFGGDQPGQIGGAFRRQAMADGQRIDRLQFRRAWRRFRRRLMAGQGAHDAQPGAVVQRQRGVVAFDHFQRQPPVAAVAGVRHQPLHQRLAQALAAHLRAHGKGRDPAVTAAAGDQRHRHRFMAVGDDQAVVQAEIFGAETGGEGRPVDNEAHDVVFKAVAEDIRQFVAAVAQGVVEVEASVVMHG